MPIHPFITALIRQIHGSTSFSLPDLPKLLSLLFKTKQHETHRMRSSMAGSFNPVCTKTAYHPAQWR
jgi:hypothetical protein